MKKVTTEQLISRLLGEKKKIEINNKVIEKYKKDYIKIYGDDLEDVIKVINCTYKIIVLKLYYKFLL